MDRCAICRQPIPNILERGLVPINCKKQPRHRICQGCWWAPGGFAEESRSHKCPGCEKNIPPPSLPTAEPEIIDLTG